MLHKSKLAIWGRNQTRGPDKDPNTEPYSSFQSGIPTLETTQKA